MEELHKNDMIEKEAERILLELVAKQDGRVIAAFRAYVQSKDGADLIDSLLRIAAFELAQRHSAPPPSSSSSSSQTARTTAATAQRRAPQQQQAAAEDSGGDSDSGESETGNLLSKEDQKTVVQILLRSGK